MLNRAQAPPEKLIQLRRDVQRHPEKGFLEFGTAALVAGKLREIGSIEVLTNVGCTGISWPSRDR